MNLTVGLKTSLRSIRPELLSETAGRLVGRIGERFPDSNLLQVAREVQALCSEAPARLEYFSRPLWWWRVLAVMLIASFLCLIALMCSRLGGIPSFQSLSDLVQAIEAGINDLIFLCLGAYFLISAESRVRRKRVLSALQELRALAHIIDLHQLTKDPERVSNPEEDTQSSPKRMLNAFQLGRYLDYCSELLSLLSKLAALYVEKTSDGELVRAVDEIESLTNGLSRKIWQKIMVMGAH